MRIRHIVLLVCIFLNINIYAQNIKNTDTEELERAIEYFQGEKFHEALLLLQELNNHSRHIWVSVFIMIKITKMHVNI